MFPVLHKWPPFILYFPHYWCAKFLLDLWILPSSGRVRSWKNTGNNLDGFGPNGPHRPGWQPWKESDEIVLSFLNNLPLSGSIVLKFEMYLY